MRRSEYEQDEGSCICGLNKGILDQLESIVITSTSSCSINKHQEPSSDQSIASAQPQARDPDAPVLSIISGQGNGVSEEETQTHEEIVRDDAVVTSLVPATTSITSLTATSDESHEQSSKVESTNTLKPDEQSSSQAASGGFTSLSIDLVTQLTSEIHKLQTQLNSIQGQQQQTVSSQTPLSSVVSTTTTQPSITSSSSSSYGYSFMQSINENTSKPVSLEVNQEQQMVNGAKVPNGAQTIIITGFLSGLPASTAILQNEAMSKLNQSKAVEPTEMASALQSTVPNVVSNIFSSIHNLTLSTEQNRVPADEPNSGKLTSIDGYTVEIHKGDSKDDITANGEKLFTLWIEHQLNNLHLTASMANYIRKSALSMFRKIVNQYVDRMTRVGGSLEYNVQRATQMALHNTQNLISFLLKNYINFAGGLMQIIGEQVSRVGKQLDVTGDKIAQTSLNPFDIVSNVIDSLPNPSNYSKYFREFGKQLIGGGSSTTTPAPVGEVNPLLDDNKHQADESSNPSVARPQGLITKTMGALSKTLNKLLG